MISLENLNKTGISKRQQTDLIWASLSFKINIYHEKCTKDRIYISNNKKIPCIGILNLVNKSSKRVSYMQWVFLKEISGVKIQYLAYIITKGNQSNGQQKHGNTSFVKVRIIYQTASYWIIIDRIVTWHPLKCTHTEHIVGVYKK